MRSVNTFDRQLVADMQPTRFLIIVIFTSIHSFEFELSILSILTRIDVKCECVRPFLTWIEARTPLPHLRSANILCSLIMI